MTPPFEIARRLSAGEKVHIDKNLLFIVKRILSFEPEVIQSIQRINTANTPPEITEELLNCLPKFGPKTFFRYSRRKESKKEITLISLIQQTFTCSEEHARQTIRLLRMLKIEPLKYYGFKCKG